MPSDTMKQEWKGWAKKIRQNCSELSEQDLAEVDGDRGKLTALIQRTYGWSDVRTERFIASIFGI